MSSNVQIINLRECKDGFEKLQAIAYKDICVNGLLVRILGIHWMDCAPDWVVRKHRHSFFEFHYVIGGSVLTTINNTEYMIPEGSFYLMPPGTHHAHRQPPGQGHTGFALRWEFIQEKPMAPKSGNTSFEMERLLPHINIVHPMPIKDDGKTAGNVSKLLYKAICGAGVLELQLHFLQVILGIMFSYQNGPFRPARETNYTQLENRIVEVAVRYIEENYNEDIDVYDVSNSVHLSYSHLSRLFRKHMDNTIIQYINTVRVMKAQQLLLCSDKTVSQIAREVGFSSAQYFCSIFLKHFGMRPGIFRKEKPQLSE